MDNPATAVPPNATYQILKSGSTVEVHLLSEYPEDTIQANWKPCTWQGYAPKSGKIEPKWSQDGIIGVIRTDWQIPEEVPDIPVCVAVTYQGQFLMVAPVDIRTKFRAMKNTVVINFLYNPAEF